ncbi:MAG TPA: hypothetical protein VGO80_14305 [Solirubrobacteraceae bacterium]|nr:hypothetical protein [Solirubrobacteraceae bacterium]
MGSRGLSTDARPGLVMLAVADPYPSGDERLSIEMAHRLVARMVRFDDLGASWIVEDPQLVAATLQTFWSLP